jgi:N-acetylneuraminic acid mutarotase
MGCSSSDDSTDVLGNWTKVTPFKGRPRGAAISFTIGNKVYVGLGYDGDEYLSDFYVFDIDKGYWESKKAFPGTLRERAVAFSVDGKGYVGLGYNRDLKTEELKDFWQYDPATDTWKEIISFGGTARYNAIGFSIGSKGYVGTGFDGNEYNGDFWQFDPVDSAWTEVNSYPGEKIEAGLAFVVDNKAYICTGRNNLQYNNDFWEFDPTGSEIVWTKRSPDDSESDYDEFKLAVRRHDAVAFTMDNKAYIVGGISSSGAADKTVYEFNATTLNWAKKTSYEGAARSKAVAYVLNGRAFVGTGQNAGSYFDDVWEFKPNEEEDEND